MTKRDAQAYVLLVVIAALLVGLPLAALAAMDWDWRCLFVECRRMKS